MELGLWLKQHSPARFTIPVGHCPYYTGYLPNQAILKEGGFEAQTHWSGYADGTGEAVADGLLLLLRELFPSTGTVTGSDSSRAPASPACS